MRKNQIKRRERKNNAGLWKTTVYLFLIFNFGEKNAKNVACLPEFDSFCQGKSKQNISYEIKHKHNDKNTER